MSIIVPFTNTPEEFVEPMLTEPVCVVVEPTFSSVLASKVKLFEPLVEIK
jgi:hypothetical protein